MNDTPDPGAVERMIVEADHDSHPARTQDTSEPPASMGNFEQMAGRADRPGSVARAQRESARAESANVAHLITTALDYSHKTGMPVNIAYAGIGTAYVECDRRTIRILQHPTDWQFESKYFAAPDDTHGESLGVFDTFTAAAEAPLPAIDDRVLRVTLDVLVIDAREESEDPDDAPPLAQGSAESTTLHDLQPEDVADVLATDAGMHATHTYGAHPWDRLLEGSGMFVRFGYVQVHDAQWVPPQRKSGYDGYNLSAYTDPRADEITD